MSFIKSLFKIPATSHIAEDASRRALASGDVTRDATKTLLALAHNRNKPQDIVHVHQLLQRSGCAGLLNERELQASLTAEKQRRVHMHAKGGKALRIAIYHHSDWHRSLGDEIANQVGDELVLRTNSERELLGSKPDVVLSSLIPRRTLTKLRRSLPDTFWVYIRHGFANKRASFGLAGGFDAVCVSSQYVANLYTGLGFFPEESVWITGYPPLDRLVQASGYRHGDHPTVLYAPTFNRTLSSASAFGPALVEEILQCHRRVRLIVKLHPATIDHDPVLWRKWAEACSQYDNACFVEDPATDLLSLFNEATMLISDFSSAAFSFLATRRPILLLSPPEAGTDHASYDPDGIEWKWRDMAEEIHDMDKLTPVLRNILAGRDDYAAARERYRKLLFDDTLDGNSAARVMQRLGQVFGRGPG